MRNRVTGTFLMAITLLALLAFLLPSTRVLGSSSINLVVLPTSQTVVAGQSFNITVQAQRNGQQLDGIEVHLDFSTTRLQVQTIAPGNLMEYVLQNVYDNTLGTIDYSAGTFNTTLSDTFTVVTVTFKARSGITSSTSQINFHNSGNTTERQTFADFGGYQVPVNTTGCSYTIYSDTPLSLNPSSVGPISSNQTFNMDIRTSVSPSQQITGVQAYVNFDTTKIEVVQITPGTTLTTVLQNTFDNTTGLVSYAAGQLTTPFPTGDFIVATIQFRTKTVTSATVTPVTIDLSAPTTSLVDFSGTAIPGTHGDASVQIVPGAKVNLSMVLQGGSRPDAGWAIPLTIKFFNPGANMMTGNPVYSFYLITTKSGSNSIAQVAGINPGTYDITANSTTTLTNVKRSVIVSVPSTTINLGTLLEGDANGSGSINIQDFGILAASYGKSTGPNGFDTRADFDRNGIINIADFGLLASNYGKYSPTEIP